MADNVQAFGIDRDVFFHVHANDDVNAVLLKHVCPPTFGGGPVDPVPADRQLEHSLMTRFELALPPNVAARFGRDRLPMWIIRENRLRNPREAYPSPLIRMVQGEVIHAEVGASTNTHTIHWHGIEPTPMNDGVGKHSFEISGNFTYQFQTNEAGTYFYHCHKNTVLHFNMGLWGGLIVDPKNPNLPADNNLNLPNSPNPINFPGLTPPYQTFGPGYAHGNRQAFGLSPGSAIPYHRERIWAVDSLQFNWHFPEPHHNHNMQDCDQNDPAGADTFYKFGTATDMGEFEMNNFSPDIFSVTGVVLDVATGPPFIGEINHPNLAINATAGELVLLRYINASYTIQELRLPVPATVTAWDGHPLGLPGFHEFSSPYVVPANTPIRTTSARRPDIILDTRGMPSFQGFATIRVYDWIKGVNAQGFLAEIRIPVNIQGVEPPPGHDTVRITRARFNFNRNREVGTLDLRAASDREGVTLTAKSTAFPDTTLVRNRARISGITQRSFTVRVESSGGGFDEVFVQG